MEERSGAELRQFVIVARFMVGGREDDGDTEKYHRTQSLTRRQCVDNDFSLAVAPLWAESGINTGKLSQEHGPLMLYDCSIYIILSHLINMLLFTMITDSSVQFNSALF